MQVVQCRLKSGDTFLTTHLEHRFKKKTLRKGMFVELKDDLENGRERLWEIMDIYGQPIEKNSLHRGWDNNY